MKNTEKDNVAVEANEKEEKVGLWGKVQDWYAKPNVQLYVGIVYSLGAAVVIVGALFKIMHWPGASFMLTCGMATEALLFTIGIFEKPHVTYHWENIFPFVIGEEPKPINYDGTIGGNFSGGNQGASIPNIEKLSDSDSKSLTDSIKKISETAAQFANISEVASITNNYKNNLANAAAAAEQFANKQISLDEASNSLLSSYADIAGKMTSANESTNLFAEKAVELNKNLGSINTAYEFHLKEVQKQTSLIESQSNAVNDITTNINKIHESVDASAQNMDTYKQMTDQLAKNISDLNNVYGNMLNAIKA